MNPKLAILVHRLMRARVTADEAMAHIQAAGFSVAVLDRALALACRDPAEIDGDERQAAELLTAICAPVEVETIEVFERVRDDASSDHLRRAWAAGYFSAVLCRPDDRGGFTEGTPAHRQWSAGRAAFLADLEQEQAHEARALEQA